MFVTERETTAWPFRCAGLLRRWWGRCVGLPKAELVAVRVLAGREPAHARNRHRLARLPTELVHPRCTGLDVIDREVRSCAALARLHVRDRRGPRPLNLTRVILERAGVGLELPPKQRAPELLALDGVVGRDLDVHDLTRHRCLLGWSFTAMLPSVLNTVRSRAARWSLPGAGPLSYFRTRDRIGRARVTRADAEQAGQAGARGPDRGGQLPAGVV